MKIFDRATLLADIQTKTVNGHLVSHAVVTPAPGGGMQRRPPAPRLLRVTSLDGKTSLGVTPAYPLGISPAFRRVPGGLSPSPF